MDPVTFVFTIDPLTFAFGIAIGFVAGVGVVSYIDHNADPHCGLCAKLVHRCTCYGGPR